MSKKTVVSVDGPLTGAAITCDSGAVWITQCCDSRDYVLTPGVKFVAQGEGRITVQTIMDGRVSIRIRGRANEELRRLSWKRLKCCIAALIPKGP